MYISVAVSILTLMCGTPVAASTAPADAHALTHSILPAPFQLSPFFLQFSSKRRLRLCWRTPGFVCENTRSPRSFCTYICKVFFPSESHVKNDTYDSHDRANDGYHTHFKYRQTFPHTSCEQDSLYLQVYLESPPFALPYDDCQCVAEHVRSHIQHLRCRCDIGVIRKRCLIHLICPLSQSL